MTPDEWVSYYFQRKAEENARPQPAIEIIRAWDEAEFRRMMDLEEEYARRRPDAECD